MTRFAEPELTKTADPRRRAESSPVADPTVAAMIRLQRTAGNRAVVHLLQRQTPPTAADATSAMNPKKHATFESWLGALPSGAVDYQSVDVTGDVRKGLPELADLVRDLRADCADVTILLRHYYLQAHQQSGSLPGWDAAAKKRKKFQIGAGVSREALRKALIDLGTIHFQEFGKTAALVDFYGGRRPIKNLRKLLDLGLTGGELLVWKKKAGIRGRFSGHVQTVQRIFYELTPDEPKKGKIEVLQGTMEGGQAKGQVQSKVLSFELLTGKPDGDGEITFEPSGEEVFYGAGRWR